MIEACQSPVWDTCLATIALADAGLPADHPALVKAADWMLGEQITRPGDWSVAGPQLAARRLGVRVPQRQLPRHRRHRRGRPRAAPGRPPRPGRGWTRPSRAGCAGTSACSPRTAPGAPSTPTTPARSPTGCRSATSARSSTRRRPTSPRTSWRCWPSRAWRTTRAPGAASSGCSPNRRPDGAWFGRWGVNYIYGTGSAVPALDRGRPARRPPGDPARGRLAGVGAERRRRLGRGPALLPRREVDRPRRLHRLPDRLGAAGPARGRGARTPRPSSAASPGWPRPSWRTAPGTSRTSPAPASPGTSPSTTTSTGRSSRSPRSAATCTASPSPTELPRQGRADTAEPLARPAPPRC